MQSSPMSINFKAIDEKSKTIQGKKYETITIKSSSKSNGPIDLSSFFAVNYDLGENIGFIDGKIQIKIPTKGTYDVEIALQSFLNPL
jgi:hypothetical protein